jgi:hypothetical protein
MIRQLMIETDDGWDSRSYTPRILPHLAHAAGRVRAAAILRNMTGN